VAYTYCKLSIAITHMVSPFLHVNTMLLLTSCCWLTFSVWQLHQVVSLIMIFISAGSDKSGIRPSPAPVKFLAGFGRCQCSCSVFS